MASGRFLEAHCLSVEEDDTRAGTHHKTRKVMSSRRVSSVPACRELASPGVVAGLGTAASCRTVRVGPNAP